MTARTRKGWNTKLDADRYRVQCLEAFCASLRSISAMNKSIRARRIKYKREKPRLSLFLSLSPWLAASLPFSPSLFVYIFFFHRVLIARLQLRLQCTVKRGSVQDGNRDARQLADYCWQRRHTGALAELFTNRRAGPNSIWRCVNAHCKKKERWNENRKKDGYWKGCWGGWEIQQRPGLSLLIFRIRRSGSCSRMLCWCALRSLETTYLTYANASWFHRRIAGD